MQEKPARQRPLKITFMGAGSTVFVKNILGDCMCAEPLRDAEFALYDIDASRLEQSQRMLQILNRNINGDRAVITVHCGKGHRRRALAGASYVVNAIQVGGYRPSTVIDFEVPKRYGLRQTIGDTLGIGGIFRALRTIPVVLEFARDMEAVCPDAWFLNYTNPMAMVTAGLLRGSSIRGVGLCHSWHGTAWWMLHNVGLADEHTRVDARIAGINHQAWVLSLTVDGKDMYPEFRRRASLVVEHCKRKNSRPGASYRCPNTFCRVHAACRRSPVSPFNDIVRWEFVGNFGYQVTESSEHNAEYVPWFIKRTHPELIRQYGIPLDEYPRRCEQQIRDWKKQYRTYVRNGTLSHERTHEYGSYIMEALESGSPFVFGGNVMNDGLITNLPSKACVEVACVADRTGVTPTRVGDLPEALAAINRTAINPQILTVEAALTRKREYIYQAALLDPHTAAELSVDEIRALVDDLIEAHGSMLPVFR
jgi:alpha-galactosidase